MTDRTMGDATHDNVAALPSSIQLVAGYDTGTPDIQWTAADWAKFPDIPHVHIDQGYSGNSPVYSANVIDIEPGAWSPQQATGWLDNCTAPRPTVYCDRSELTAVVQAAQQSKQWQGDVWLAYPSWQPGTALPTVPTGVRFVAVQNNFGSAYDTSVVLDSYWPEEAPVDLPVKSIPAPPGKGNVATIVITGSNGGMYVATWDQATDTWTQAKWPVK